MHVIGCKHLPKPLGPRHTSHPRPASAVRSFRSFLGQKSLLSGPQLSLQQFQGSSDLPPNWVPALARATRPHGTEEPALAVCFPPLKTRASATSTPRREGYRYVQLHRNQLDRNRHWQWQVQSRLELGHIHVSSNKPPGSGATGSTFKRHTSLGQKGEDRHRAHDLEYVNSHEVLDRSKHSSILCSTAPKRFVACSILEGSTSGCHNSSISRRWVCDGPPPPLPLALNNPGLE